MRYLWILFVPALVFAGLSGDRPVPVISSNLTQDVTRSDTMDQDRIREYVDSLFFVNKFVSREQVTQDTIIRRDTLQPDWAEITKYVDREVERSREQSSDLEFLKEVKTSYRSSTGLVANQGQYRQGFHVSLDTVTLVSGEATIDLNTQVSPGKRDVSFVDVRSYGGVVHSLDTASDNTYRIVSLSGGKFRIVSSDSTDIGTVKFMMLGD